MSESPSIPGAGPNIAANFFEISSGTYVRTSGNITFEKGDNFTIAIAKEDPVNKTIEQIMGLTSSTKGESGGPGTVV